MSDEPNANSARIEVKVADRMVDFTEQEILSRLSSFEDHFVERKTAGDSKDWLKTAVAFANSVPIGYPAILFVGVKNDGAIEGQANLDSLQQSFSKILNDAYPPIYYTPKVISHDGKQCLAVIIPGSPLRPHFAGQSYIRDGSQTKKASEAQFMELIAQRNSKTREILKWKGQQVTLRALDDRAAFAGMSLNKGGSEAFTVVDCNQFYVTVAHGAVHDSISLETVEISHDYQNKRLRLEAHSY